MTQLHTQHSTNSYLIIRGLKVVYIDRVNLLVCECVINKYPIIALVNYNTPRKNQSVLEPCCVFPVQIRPRACWGITKVNRPC